MTRGFLAPVGRRQPVERPAQQQGRDVRRHREALARGRRGYVPRRADGRQLAGLGIESVDAADVDRLAARGKVDGRPSFAALDRVEQAAELLRVALEQAALVVLEV